MPSRELPARPNLEQLKKQAKSLLDAAQARDADALRRFAIAARASRQVARRRSPPPVSRCTTRSRPSRANTASRRGMRCARKSNRARCRSTRRSTNSSAARAAARPDAPSGCWRSIRASPRPSLHTALVLGDAARGRERLAKQPELAQRRRRAPALGAAALRLPHVDGSRTIRRGSTASSRSRGACCALGANPNGEYHWNWHPELPRTGALGLGLRRPASAARRGAARGRRQSDRRRDVAHRRRRRQSRGARAAAPLRPRT